MSRWSAADLARVSQSVRDEINGTKRPKYRNQRLTFQGLTYDSKKELKDYQDLKSQQALGAIRGVARQVSLQLPNTSRRIRIDFVVIENDGRIRWMDSKGYESKEWALKRQIVKDAFGIEIELI